MSATLFKQQASRLTEHLSSVHKVRLKHAGSLEAIAAIHGAKDWNTLLALAGTSPALFTYLDDFGFYDKDGRGKGVPAGRMVATSGKDNFYGVKIPAAPTAAEAMGVLFPKRQFTDPDFCSALLSTRFMVVGGPEAERNALVDHLVYRQAQRMGGFLYLDWAEDDVRDKLAYAMDAAGRLHDYQVVDFQNPDNSYSYNPFHEGDAESLADVAAHLGGPASPGNPGADYYRISQRHFMVALLTALRTLEAPVTLGRLAHILAQPDKHLADLEALLPDDSPARKDFRLFLDGFRKQTKEGLVLDGAKLQLATGALTGRMAMLAQSKSASLLGTEKPDAILTDVLRQGKGLYVRVDRHNQRRLAEIVLANLTAALEGLAKEGGRLPPFTVFVPHLSDCLPDTARRLFELFKQMEVGLVCFGQPTEGVSRSSGNVSMGGQYEPPFSLANEIQLVAEISAAGGFGRNAHVRLTNQQLESVPAELAEFRLWPDKLPTYQKP